MFALQHIHKSFGDKVILDDINLSVGSGEVIALIGENGAGKTTPLKILLGKLKPDAGTIDVHDEAIGYVPQEAELIGTIQDSFDTPLEDWQKEYALSLVGLESVPKETAISNLSGGQKTRLALAKVLASEPAPTVLLLDEPTNNLDADGLAWLEQFIKSYRGGIILVSHDRTFINTVATSVLELRDCRLKQYGGNYDFYKQQKEIEYQTAVDEYQKSIEERKHLKTVLRDKQDKAARGLRDQRMRDNDKAQFNWHQNNVQRSFSCQARALQSRLDQLEDVEKPAAGKDYTITIGGDVPPAKLILRTSELRKSYGTMTLTYPAIELRDTERLHIQGQNGSGKTTLLKMIAGLTDSDSGEITRGQNITYGYFSQDIDGLDYRLTNLENLESTGAQTTAIYREAKSLGLDQADLKKRPGELSRGQQAKLSFAKLLLIDNQLLILDEPTNHLDIPTREEIEAALTKYGGAIIFASHDSYFANSLGITKILLLS